MNGKKTLQPEKEGVALQENTAEKSLADENRDLKTQVENDKLRLEHEALVAGFKTAVEYLRAVDEQDKILNELNEKLEQVREREQVVDIKERELVRATKEAEKIIRYAEILKPLGEGRTQIVELLKQILGKVTELVNIPDAFREFNKYGVEKEHDKLDVEIRSLIKTWLAIVQACKESMVK